MTRIFILFCLFCNPDDLWVSFLLTLGINRRFASNVSVFPVMYIYAAVILMYTMWFVSADKSTHMKDESEIVLACSISGQTHPVLRQHARGGWDTDVVSAFYDKMTGYNTIDNLHPFVVGGVASNTFSGYTQLRCIAAVGHAWNALITTPTVDAATAVLGALRELDTAVAPVLPDSPLCRLQAQLSEIESATKTMLIIHDHLQTNTAFPPGLLANSYNCFAIDKVVAMLVGNEIVALGAQLDAEFDLGVLAEAESWAKQYKGADAAVVECTKTIGGLLQSVRRTGQDMTQSTIAESTIAAWKTLA